MKSSFTDKYEICFLVMGYDGVGKKSFVKRLKTMNSSSIKEIHKEYKEPTPQDIKKILFSKENTFANKNELIQFKKKEFKLEKICSFKKILTIEFTYMELTAKIIKKPQPILISDNKNIIEELENTEKAHNLKFNVVKQQLLETINETSKNNAERGYKTLFVLLFMFDLGNFDSFEKILFYYEEVNRFLNIENQNSNIYDLTAVFVGNKIDQKQVLPKKIKEEVYDKFFESIPYMHYDISTAYYYNFEKFFKSLFVDVIAKKLHEEAKKDYFITKLDQILFFQKT